MADVKTALDIYELNREHTEKQYINSIVQLHTKAFPDFFLTRLGKPFLRVLYKGYLEDDNSGIIVAKKDGILVGFIAYSKEYSAFYKGLIKHHIIRFFLCSAAAAVKHPSFSKRLFGAFKKSNSVIKTEPYVELASICVSPDAEHSGIGTMMIRHLIENTDFSKYDYINLETDADNNDSVNSFYIKNGFRLARQYLTNEKRKMNEYRYGEKYENLVH